MITVVRYSMSKCTLIFEDIVTIKQISTKINYEIDHDMYTIVTSDICKIFMAMLLDSKIPLKYKKKMP